MTESRAQTTEEIVEALAARAAWHDGEVREHSALRPDIAGRHRKFAELDRLAAARLTALSEELGKARKALDFAGRAIATWMDDDEENPESNQGLVDAFAEIDAARAALSALRGEG